MSHVRSRILVWAFSSLFGLMASVALGAQGAEQYAHRLVGTIGVSTQWGSGWIDLDKPTQFNIGDHLRLKVGGSAERILVRLLPSGQFPDSPAGIVGAGIVVPADRIVDIAITASHLDIVQVSVHGASNPWGNSLGAKNGPATLEAAHVLKASKSADKKANK